MLEFILGKSGSGKTFCCFQQIKMRLENNQDDSPLLLITPDHMTFTTSQDLLKNLPHHASMRCYVSGFRYFAWLLARERREMKSTQTISQLGKQLLLKKILHEKHDHLVSFQKNSLKRGFAQKMIQTIDELKLYDTTPKKLQTLIDRNEMPNDFLQSKMKDITFLYETFLQKTEHLFEDNYDRMMSLSENILTSKFLEGAEIWIDGFTSFPPVLRKVIENFLKRVETVHITLPMEKEPDEFKQGSPSLFYDSKREFFELKKIAERNNIPYEVLQEKNLPRFSKNKTLAEIEEKLFTFQFQKSSEEVQGLELTEAANVPLEITSVCQKIIYLVREEKFRYRDIGVLIRDKETYLQQIEFAFADYGIPFFTDEKSAGVYHPLSELLRSSLEVVQDNFSYESVFQCVKTNFFGIEQDDIDRLENYVLEFGIRGAKKWNSVWQKVPQNLRSATNPEEFLDKINSIREKVFVPLSHLQSHLKTKSTVKNYSLAIFDFFEELHVPQTLQQWKTQAENNKEFVEAIEHKKIWDCICGLFDELLKVSEIDATENISAKEFAELLSDGLDSLQIAFIPQKLDAVTLASFDQNSLQNTKAIFIVGVNDGVMPQRKESSGVLTDNEKEILQKKQINLAPNNLEESFHESYLLYHAFTLATEYLHLSWSLSDTAGEKMSPSSLIERLKKIFPDEKNKPVINSVSNQNLQNISLKTISKGDLHQLPFVWKYLSVEKQKVFENWKYLQDWVKQYDKIYFEKLKQAALKKNESKQLPKKIALQLFAPHNKLRSSVTQMEQFNGCPFAYFSRYGLKLKPRAKYEFRSLELGNLLHKVAQEFGQHLKASKKQWSDVNEDECLDLCKKFIKNNLNDFDILESDESYKNLLQRITDTAVSSFLSLISFHDGFEKFEPTYFEKEFIFDPEDKDSFLELSGKIDRVDLAPFNGKTFYLVFDYKSSEKQLHLNEIEEGLQLQLVTYVLVMDKELKNQNGTVAGMLYCRLHNQTASPKKILSFDENKKEETKAELRKNFQLAGWVEHSENAEKPKKSKTAKQNETVQDAEKNKNIVNEKLIQIAKMSTEFKTLYTAKDLEKIKTTVKEKLIESGTRILSGEIQIAPYQHKKKTACDYCEYKNFCGFNEDFGNTYRRLGTAKSLNSSKESQNKNNSEEAAK